MLMHARCLLPPARQRTVLIMDVLLTQGSRHPLGLRTRSRFPPHRRWKSRTAAERSGGEDSRALALKNSRSSAEGRTESSLFTVAEAVVHLCAG